MSQKTMTKTKCSSCGKECEVPFKPTPGKPVYCRECFATHRHMPQKNSGKSSPAFEPKQAWARRRPPMQSQTSNELARPLHKFSHAP